MKRIHFLNACYWWTICPIIMRLIFNDLVIFNQNSVLPSTINSKFACVFCFQLPHLKNPINNPQQR